MKIRIWNYLFGVIAALAMLGALAGYLFRGMALVDSLALLLVQWAGILTALAVCIGVFNLALVHLNKIIDQKTGWFYSLILLLGLVVGLGTGLVAVLQFVAPESLTFLTPEQQAQLVNMRLSSVVANRFSLALFKYLLIPLGAALGGLMLFFLVFAAFRILRRRPSVLSISFVITLVLALAFMMPWFYDNQLEGTRAAALQLIAGVCAVAGARGLLLGIALGTIATGLRVLLMRDRPYGD